MQLNYSHIITIAAAILTGVVTIVGHVLIISHYKPKIQYFVSGSNELKDIVVGSIFIANTGQEDADNVRFRIETTTPFQDINLEEGSTSSIEYTSGGVGENYAVIKIAKIVPYQFISIVFSRAKNPAGAVDQPAKITEMLYDGGIAIENRKFDYSSPLRTMTTFAWLGIIAVIVIVAGNMIGNLLRRQMSYRLLNVFHFALGSIEESEKKEEFMKNVENQLARPFYVQRRQILEVASMTYDYLKDKRGEAEAQSEQKNE